MKVPILPGSVTILIFLLKSIVLPAQEYPEQLLHKPFAVRCYALDSISYSVRNEDSSTALPLIDKLEQWADKKNDLELKYEFGLMRFSWMIRKNNKTNYFVEKNLLLFIKDAGEKKLLYVEAQALNLMAGYYWTDNKRFNYAFEYSLSAFNIYSKFSDQEFPLRSDFLYGIGLAYYRFKDYRSSITCYQGAEKARKYGWSPQYHNIYNAAGLCYRQMGIYDSAEYYFKLGYELVKSGDTVNGLRIWKGIIGGNLGITYYLEGRYQEAIPLLEQDVAICTSRNPLADNAIKSMSILGDCYFFLNDKKRGLDILQRCYQMIRDGNKGLEITSQVYPLLAKAYAETGDYRLAYNFLDSARRVSDSESNQRNTLILVRALEKTDLEKHRAEMREHQKELKIQFLVRIFFTVSIALLLLVIFFVYRNYRNQRITNMLLSNEKKRSEDLLLNILPSEVAEELKNKGVAEARFYDHVTVLFTDFVNFTGAGERMSPKLLIDELHHCFKAFDGIMDKYNIEKIKTIGDAYLAVAGLPVPDEEHAEHIVSAAKEIMQFMRDRKQEIGDMAFDIRIGIHSGSVVAGIVGLKKFAYDVWGDAVNIAARMEQSSESGKINISQTTYELVNNKFTCTYRGELEAKNKGMMKMYFVE